MRRGLGDWIRLKGIWRRSQRAGICFKMRGWAFHHHQDHGLFALQSPPHNNSHGPGVHQPPVSDSITWNLNRWKMSKISVKIVIIHHQKSSSSKCFLQERPLVRLFDGLRHHTFVRFYIRHQTRFSSIKGKFESSRHKCNFSEIKRLPLRIFDHFDPVPKLNF